MNILTRRLTTGAIILGSLLMYSVFSFSSSREAIVLLTGMAMWGNVIAFALVAIDFAGVGRLLAPWEGVESIVKWGLFCAWLLTAVFDVGLTFVILQNRMASLLGTHPLVLRGIVSPAFIYWYAPFAIAAFCWGIQVLLATSAHRAFSDIFAGLGGISRKSNRPGKKNKSSVAAESFRNQE